MLRRRAHRFDKFNVFNAVTSKNHRSPLIWVSGRSGALAHTCAMISQASCIQKAETCETRAAACLDAPSQAQWLSMAAEWRALAGDETDQATLARLMGAFSAAV
jgi:hypothetical protein